MNILLVGPTKSYGGYGASSRFWANALIPHNNVKIINFDDYSPGYDYTTHDNKQYDPNDKTWTPHIIFNANNPVGYKPATIPQACSTAWETDTLPPRMGQPLQTHKLVTIQSTYNKPTFEKWHNNVKVVPMGIDAEKWHPTDAVRDDNIFTFISNGKWEYRKNFVNLVRAFDETFKGNQKVRLLIKTQPYQLDGSEINNLIVANNKHNSKILLNYSNVNENLLMDYYTSSDVFVLPTRGEGFGVPFLEAMACKLPLIATNGGGHMDFVNEKNALLVDASLKKVFPHNVYDDTMRMFEPSMKDLKDKLQYAFDNQSEMRKLGEAGRKTAEKYDYRIIGKLMTSILEKEFQV